MGRDRDPFERTLSALRETVVEQGPLQGAPLAVNAIAARLGVSPTPVREALSRLAGEGLVAHTLAGYAGVEHDAHSLAGLYGLTSVLSLSLVRARDAAKLEGASLIAAIDDLVRRADNQALGGALSRVMAQLAPFAAAERACLSPERWPPAAGEHPEYVRRYYARRARRSSDILAAAITTRIASKL